MADIQSKLQAKGYQIEQKSASESITGISLNSSTVSVPVNETATITVTYESYSKTYAATVTILPSESA